MLIRKVSVIVLVCVSVSLEMGAAQALDQPLLPTRGRARDRVRGGKKELRARSADSFLRRSSLDKMRRDLQEGEQAMHERDAVATSKEKAATFMFGQVQGVVRKELEIQRGFQAIILGLDKKIEVENLKTQASIRQAEERCRALNAAMNHIALRNAALNQALIRAQGEAQLAQQQVAALLALQVQNQPLGHQQQPQQGMGLLPLPAGLQPGGVFVGPFYQFMMSQAGNQAARTPFQRR